MKDETTAEGVVEFNEWGSLTPRLPESGEQQTFIRQDYVQIEGLWSASFAKALSREALSVLSERQRPESKSSEPPVRTRRSAASRQGMTEPLAPVLAHLHFSLILFARALTGRMLVPAHAWYNCYAGDDGLWLHVDTEGSVLVLLTMALGEVGPLHLHPELRGRNQVELEAIQNEPKWRPESGVSVAYPRFGLLAHRGHEVPHHRPGRPVSRPSAVAALHYASLF